MGKFTFAVVGIAVLHLGSLKDLLATFILGVVESPPFRMGTADRTLGETDAADGANQEN